MQFPAQFATKKPAGNIVAKTIKHHRKTCHGTWDVTTEAYSAFRNRKVKLVPLLYHGNMQDIIRKLLFLCWLEQDRMETELMFQVLWKGNGGARRVFSPCQGRRCVHKIFVVPRGA